MRLLDRFLLRELLLPLAYCLAGFFIFWTSYSLLSDIEKFQRQKMNALDVVEFYVAAIPEMLVVVAPIALLLALLYALTNHSRHNELTAMRAAGIGLWRICVPYLVVGFLFSLGLFAANELWAPQSAERAERVLQRNVADQNGAESLDWERDLFLRNPRDMRSWRIPAFNLRTHEMLEPEVVWLLPDGGRREIYAERAVFTGAGWVFHDVQETVYSSAFDVTPRINPHEQLAMPEFGETPELIRSEVRINRLSVKAAAKRAQLPIRDILNYLALHPDLAGSQRSVLGTQLHGRIAAPWSCLTVVLVAIPFGVVSGRRNAFVGVAGSIVLMFAYFVLQRLGLALGIGGRLEPWVAAWLPNLAFAGLGILLMLRIR